MYKKMFSVVLALIASFAMVAAPMAAPKKTPEGLWELDSRDTRFEAALCEGDKLCVTLVWLAEGARSPENMAYMNKRFIDRADRVQDRAWRGQFNLYGWVAKGKVTQESDDVMNLRGCVLAGVVCKDFKLYRVEQTAAND